MADSAAFFRVEGTLLQRPTTLAAAWLAANSQAFGSRLSGLGAVALAAPIALSGLDPTAGSRVTWMGLRGMTEDRLVVLGEEYWATWLEGHVRPLGERLVRQARQEGRQIVLVSDNLDVVIAPLAAALGADHVIANRMELRAGRATGRLVDPVVARFGGRHMADFALEHGIDLAGSSAYGAQEADAPMLAAIALPCAVHPGWRLRRMAVDLDWPVMEG